MNTALASLLVALLVATPVAAREGIPLGGDKSNPFSDLVQGQFLPAKEAFQASAWRDDERLYVGFLNAEDYYLHRHQFALDSRSRASVSVSWHCHPGNAWCMPRWGRSACSMTGWYSVRPSRRAEPLASR
ncbi:hypothetical protein [Halomonas sp. M20]|uniref:hypothetical protein n=1 Tax=Halomonas sp. M20 TaxID=2763264 RepID=UPI001D0A667F|nr:hypothetical protein [Halomonas sp. M20]